MTGPYDDILNLPHHVSRTRKRMSRLDRAAQFSPFSALTGYDAAIRETARLTDDAVELDTDGVTMLDEKLQHLARLLPDQPEITVTHFVPDVRKTGGCYTTVTGRLKKLDPVHQILALDDGTIIPFQRLLGISGAGENDE